MKHIPHLLEREDVNTRINQVAIRYHMGIHNVSEEDFRKLHCWINQGLNISSKGVYREKGELRRYQDDRTIHTWGRYESLEEGAPKDLYAKIYLMITIEEDFSCTVERIERGVYDTAFALYQQIR